MIILEWGLYVGEDWFKIFEDVSVNSLIYFIELHGFKEALTILL